MTREEIVKALRCISTPGDHCTHCESCPFLRWEKLTEEQASKFGMAELENCDADAVGFAAADLIENQQNHIAALMKANGSLKDTIARRDKEIERLRTIDGVQVYCEKPVCPCAHCDTGWGEATARGVRSCYENCERLKEWREKAGGAADI